jgi:hypothetical protein
VQLYGSANEKVKNPRRRSIICFVRDCRGCGRFAYATNEGHCVWFSTRPAIVKTERSESYRTTPSAKEVEEPTRSDDSKNQLLRMIGCFIDARMIGRAIDIVKNYLLITNSERLLSTLFWSIRSSIVIFALTITIYLVDFAISLPKFAFLLFLHILHSFRCEICANTVVAH